MQDIITFAIFPGLPFAALIRGSISLFRREALRMFFGLNLAALIVVGIAVSFIDGDPNAPVSNPASILYLFGYVPAHLIMMAVIYGIYRLIYRRRKRALASNQS